MHLGRFVVRGVEPQPPKAMYQSRCGRQEVRRDRGVTARHSCVAPYDLLALMLPPWVLQARSDTPSAVIVFLIGMLTMEFFGRLVPGYFAAFVVLLAFVPAARRLREQVGLVDPGARSAGVAQLTDAKATSSPT